jgi:hypothetical protein
VAAGNRRFEADQVVVASGAYQRPRVPAFAAELDPGLVQVHSSEYRDRGGSALALMIPVRLTDGSESRRSSRASSIGSWS